MGSGRNGPTSVHALQCGALPSLPLPAPRHPVVPMSPCNCDPPPPPADKGRATADAAGLAAASAAAGALAAEGGAVPPDGGLAPSLGRAPVPPALPKYRLLYLPGTSPVGSGCSFFPVAPVGQAALLAAPPVGSSPLAAHTEDGGGSSSVAPPTVSAPLSLQEFFSNPALAHVCLPWSGDQLSGCSRTRIFAGARGSSLDGSRREQVSLDGAWLPRRAWARVPRRVGPHVNVGAGAVCVYVGWRAWVLLCAGTGVGAPPAPLLVGRGQHLRGHFSRLCTLNTCHPGP